MNKAKVFCIAALASACAFSLVSCNDKEEKEFNFTVSLQNDSTVLEVGDSTNVVINSVNEGNEARVYTYQSSNTNRLSVTDTGYVTALQPGSVILSVKETVSNITRKLSITVTNNAPLASGGFNYSSSSGTEAINRRTEILGKLEKYAVDSHLTGITLFENGGYVKYRDRLDIPADEYITGYGFGILSEGDITAPLDAETNEEYKLYYHSAQTSNPNKLNQWNATGSVVSDLAGYISSSYWGTKMNANKDGYDWYPVLAADTVDGKANNRPIPVPTNGVENPLGLYKTWRIYVKTGADGLKYRYSGSYDGGFDKRAVELKDYAFVYQLLLTGANKQTRGAEMAGDKTYGIKGAQAYYNRTKDLTDQAVIDATWKEMTKTDANGVQDPANFSSQQLGILTGSDEKGSYIQLELLNEIDKFTAMYTLSSNLVSPVPRAFIEKLAASGKVKDGILNYGLNSSSTNKTIVDNTICLGAYKLDKWIDEYIAFGQDTEWVERTTYPNRYKIKGIKITTYKDADQEALYTKFYAGLLDSCGIPTAHIDTEANQDDVRTTKGDSTFKLNVNSCTQERWNELFAEKGYSYSCKPWMSNENFLQGLYWSINRDQFAKNRGYKPSINYFADAYLSDPENGISYNDTQAHKNAVSKWHTVRNINGKNVDNYGFDYDKAVNCFRNAVNELASKGDITLGTRQKPTEIAINIEWMYATDTTEYGNEIATYFTSAFNDEAVSDGKVKLVVNQHAVSNWEDVYNEVMMKGKYDLAFGAISGNTYNPLNFLEVLKSDNSSGFTLNWGADTSKVDTKNPLVYDGKKWSFDALWEVSDRGGVVDQGVSVKTVKHFSFDGLPTLIGTTTKTSDFSKGVEGKINLEFVELAGLDIDVTKVQVYQVGGSNVNVTSFSYDKTTKRLTYTISAADGEAIKATMVELNNSGKNPGDNGYIDSPFTRSYYNSLWTIEVYFTLKINGESPSESYVTIVKDIEEESK